MDPFRAGTRQGRPSIWRAMTTLEVTTDPSIDGSPASY